MDTAGHSICQAQPLDWSPSYDDTTDEEEPVESAIHATADDDETCLPTDTPDRATRSGTEKTADSSRISAMSISELCQFLNSNGIPEEFCKVFRGKFQEMCFCIYCFFFNLLHHIKR